MFRDVSWCSVVSRGVLWYPVVFCGVWCSVVILWYSVVSQCSVVFHGIRRCSWCSVLFSGILWCSVVFSGPVCAVVFCDILWCPGVLCCPVVCVMFWCVLWCLWCSVFFCSILWCSVVSCDVLWCPMVFCGVPSCSVVFRDILWCSWCSVVFSSPVVCCSVLWYSVMSVVFCGVMWSVVFCDVPWCSVAAAPVTLQGGSGELLSAVVGLAWFSSCGEKETGSSGDNPPSSGWGSSWSGPVFWAMWGPARQKSWGRSPMFSTVAFLGRNHERRCGKKTQEIDNLLICCACLRTEVTCSHMGVLLCILQGFVSFLTWVREDLSLLLSQI